MISLLPHQLQAVEWLEKRNWRGLTFGDPGVGKSFIALEALRQSRARNALILTVASAVSQWQEEIKRFGKLNCQITVANYEKLLARIPPFALTWDAVIADECSKIKNPQSKTYRRFSQLQAPIRICLSASPIINGLYEFFSVIHWLAPGVLGKNFYSFRAIWCKTNPFIPQQIIGYRDEEELLKIIRSHYYRITDEVLALPSALREVRYVTLPEPERLRYEKIKAECQIALADDKVLTIPNLLAQIVRLIQLVNMPQTFGMLDDDGLPASSGKQVALRQALAQSEEKTIIFSDLASVCKYHHALYGGALLVGELSAKRRQEELEKFKTDPLCKYLFSSSAGSLAINLQCATRIIHYTLPYTNASLRQRLGRSRRFGQSKQVKELFFIAKDTVEEHIWKIIERKARMEMKLNRVDYKEMLEL